MTQSRLRPLVDVAYHRTNRRLALLVAAYGSAVASLVSYALSSDGRGTPSRAEFGFLLLSLLVLFYLTVLWQE